MFESKRRLVLGVAFDAIVDGIIHLVYLVLFERNLELSLYLHAVDCLQGLYWNRMFVGLSVEMLHQVKMSSVHQQSICFLLFFFCLA